MRRTALHIEASIVAGLQWAASEPNGEPLQAAIRRDVGTFLDELFRAGAFAGTRPADAYFVTCDADTTTQADTDGGLVTIVVGFAPRQPAEFVVLTIRQPTLQP